MKDNFSAQASLYAKFRPTYPKELFDFLLTKVKVRRAAWDCGTGNGQVASILSEHFEKVHATDISQSQIDNAVKKANIIYSVQPAEHTNFPDNIFDLITVAQAIHWFNFAKFYEEVNRTLKRDGIIAVIGYGIIEGEATINHLLHHFYYNVVGPYWDEERKYIDEMYKTIPFPFQEIAPPSLSMEYKWTLEQLIGYLNTWSAVAHYKKKMDHDPISFIVDDLKKEFNNNEVKRFSFPLLLRVGIGN